LAKINKTYCLAGVPVCYGYRERAFLNPTAPLFYKRGIRLIFPGNGDINNLVAVLFSALPGGYRNNNGNFNNMGNNAYFWSSTENNSNNAWNRKLNYNNTDVNRNNNNKAYGFSVRCVRALITVFSMAAAAAMLF
jgi:hypothetical protein